MKNTDNDTMSDAHLDEDSGDGQMYGVRSQARCSDVIGCGAVLSCSTDVGDARLLSAVGHAVISTDHAGK